MKFVIITNVPHFIEEKKYFSYAPYVSEINIWSKHIEQTIIVAPVSKKSKSNIDISYKKDIIFFEIKQFDILSFKGFFNSIIKIPKICITIFCAMKNADHIHLRCPGNVGLLASFIQILFPSKIKTAKYAGNWDPKAQSPLSYRLQKYILSNVFLTRKMQVLVYGLWKHQTRNIKPFFTATYSESDKIEILKKELNGKIKIVFVGTLSSGKRPLYSILLIEKLLKMNYNIEFSIYGDGIERENLEKYISENSLQKNVFLLGNHTSDTIKNAYQDSHFMLLPSESEGWPKVVAEAMFWGCVPISTSVSCVSYMLDFGNRGLLLDIDLEKDTKKVSELIEDDNRYQKMIKNGSKWSRKYTLDYFEQEIKLLLQT
jgi:glycosyltransferase involved in cell wall biosynthesis